MIQTIEERKKYKDEQVKQQLDMIDFNKIWV